MLQLVKYHTVFSILLMVCCGAQAQPPTREELPRVKITGQQRFGVIEGNMLASGPPHPPLPFEYWLLGDGFIRRRQWHEYKREEPKQAFGVANLTTITRTSVLSYRPQHTGPLRDYPVYFFASKLPEDNTPEIASMTDISAATGYSQYPYWIFQKELLASQGMPPGTTGTRTLDPDGSFRDNYWMPVMGRPNLRWREEIVRIARTNEVLFETYSHSLSGRPQPAHLIWNIHADSFHPDQPFLPRRTTARSRSMLPIITEATNIEPVPEIETHESILAEVTTGLHRLYQQHGRGDEDWDTTSIRCLDGTVVDLGKNPYQNKILHFWTSWAPRNEERFRELKEIHGRFGKDPRLQIVSINLDADEAEANAVLKKVKPAWPQARFGVDPQRASAFPFQQLPAAVFAERRRNSASDIRDLQYRSLHAADLFHRSNSTQGSAMQSVAGALKEGTAQEEAGGENVERLGPKGRKLLRQAKSAQVYRLFTEGPPIRRPVRPPVPPGMPQAPLSPEMEAEYARFIPGPPDLQKVPKDEIFYPYPVVHRGRDLGRREASLLAEILLEESCYIGFDPDEHNHREDTQDDDPFQKLGIRLQQGSERYEITFQDDIIEFDSGTRLQLTPSAAQRLQNLLDPLVPRDAESTASINAKLEEWKAAHGQAVRR